MPASATPVSHLKLALATLALGAASFAATVVGLAGENDSLFGLVGYVEYYPSESDLEAETLNQPNKVSKDIVMLEPASPEDELDGKDATTNGYFVLTASPDGNPIDSGDANTPPVEVLRFKLSTENASAARITSLKIRFVKKKSGSGSAQGNKAPACGLSNFSLVNSIGQDWSTNINPASAPGSSPLQFDTQKDSVVNPGKPVIFRVLAHLEAVAPLTTTAGAIKMHGCSFVAQINSNDIEASDWSDSPKKQTIIGQTVKGGSVTALATAPIVAWANDTPDGLFGESNQVIARLIVNNPKDSSVSLTLTSFPLKLETSEPSGSAQTARLFNGEPEAGKVLSTISLKPGKGWTKKKDGNYEAKIGSKLSKPITLKPGASQIFVLTLDTTDQAGELCVSVSSNDLSWRLAGLRALLRGVGVPALELEEMSCLSVGNDSLKGEGISVEDEDVEDSE